MLVFNKRITYLLTYLLTYLPVFSVPAGGDPVRVLPRCLVLIKHLTELLYSRVNNHD